MRYQTILVHVVHSRHAEARIGCAGTAPYLARHGVKAEVLSRPAERDVGDTLLSTAADLRSDLLVIGGDGHTRFRALLAGGVTETILKTMTVPVLVSH